MKYFLGVDPGETVGVAIYRLDHPDESNGFILLDQIKHDEFPLWLAEMVLTYDFDRIIYERFITYRQYAQRQVGSKQVASQIIGMLKLISKTKKIPLAEQGADILGIGYKWLDIKKQSDHSKSHKFDAAAHVYYWLVKSKIVEPVNVESIK